MHEKFYRNLSCTDIMFWLKSKDWSLSVIHAMLQFSWYLHFRFNMQTDLLFMSKFTVILTIFLQLWGLQQCTLQSASIYSLNAVSAFYLIVLYMFSESQAQWFVHPRAPAEAKRNSPDHRGVKSRLQCQTPHFRKYKCSNEQ